MCNDIRVRTNKTHQVLWVTSQFVSVSHWMAIEDKHSGKFNFISEQHFMLVLLGNKMSYKPDVSLSVRLKSDSGSWISDMLLEWILLLCFWPSWLMVLNPHNPDASAFQEPATTQPQRKHRSSDTTGFSLRWRTGAACLHMTKTELQRWRITDVQMSRRLSDK